MRFDAFTRWQLADYAAHDDTCGTSTTHPGHCPTTCVCWCHWPAPTVTVHENYIEWNWGRE